MRKTSGVAWDQEILTTSPLMVRFFKAEHNTDYHDQMVCIRWITIHG